MSTANQTNETAEALRFYQYINANPTSDLATRLTQALSNADTAGSRAAADAVLSAFFQASGSFAEVTPASFGAVAEYLYRFAPAWANFTDGFTYTLAFGNSHSPNSAVVPGGTISFTKNTTATSAQNNGNRGYTITYNAPDGTQTPLTFSFGQLVSEVKTATPAICLQTTFMSLALFTGHSPDAQTVIPTVFGSVNEQQAIGLSQSDASSCQSGIGQFFSTYWPVIVVGAISIISVVAYYNISRAPRIPTIRERRARDYKDGLLKKKLDVIKEEEEDDLGQGGQIPQKENPDKLKPDDLPDEAAPLFRWVESIDLSEEQARSLDDIHQLIESHPMKAYMKAELEGVKTRFDEALENSKIADESGLQLSPKSGEDILNGLEEIPESIEEVDETLERDSAIDVIAVRQARLNRINGLNEELPSSLEQFQQLQESFESGAKALVNQQTINAEKSELERQEQILENLGELGVNPTLEEAAHETEQNCDALQQIDPSSPDANQSLTQVQQNIVQTQTSLDAQTQANDGNFSAQAQQQKKPKRSSSSTSPKKKWMRHSKPIRRSVPKTTRTRMTKVNLLLTPNLVFR